MEEPTQQHEHHEHLKRDEPRIYVASLADYNDGRLVGAWLDANQEPDELEDDVQTMLATMAMPGAEEWAIHDHSGFGAFRLHEYESLVVVAKVASGLVEHGPAFAHWINVVGTGDDEAIDAFDQHYRGYWSDLESYAEDWLADLLDTEHLGPDWLRQYLRIDYEALGLALASDLETAEDEHGVFVFEVWG